MTLDFLAKNGIIVAVVTMLSSFILTISHIYYICLFYFTDEGKKLGNPDTVGYEMLLIFTISLFICSVSCLMIFGIVKKRHLYLIPWLATAFLASLYFSTCTNIIFAVGGSVIVFYPLCHLILNIRRENALSLLRDFKSNYDNNILSNCAMGTEKSTQCV